MLHSYAPLHENSNESVGQVCDRYCCSDPLKEEGSGGETPSQPSVDLVQEIFCGSWADEVEREEELLGLVTERPCDRSPVPRIKQNGKDIKRKKKKKKNKKKKKKNIEYKLFFGGIVFADLEERLFEMEESIGEEVEPEVLFAAHDTLKKLRIDCLESMFNEFGEVKRTKPNWEKRYCHVVYRNFADAFRAFQVLARTEERKKRQEEFGDALEAAGFPRFAAPRSNFYVRWPRGCPQSAPTTSHPSALPTASTPTPLCSDPTNEEGMILYWMTTTAAEARWDLLNTTPPTTPTAREHPVRDSSVASRRRPEVTTIVALPLARKEEGPMQPPASLPLSVPHCGAALLQLPLSLAA